MFKIARALPLLALVGCAGSVQVDEIDPFGAAFSAVWYHWDDSDFDSVVLSNVVGACGKWANYAEALETYQDETEDIDADDWCEDAKQPSQNLARASDALFHEGVHTLTLTVFGDGTTEPDEDTYEVLDLTALLSGTVTYYENSPASAILRDWDEDEDIEDNCGIDEDDVESDTESWTLSDGELEYTTVNDEANLSGVLEGELNDDDGDDAGEILANFSATWCEIDL